MFNLQDDLGKVDDDRIIHPELVSGEVPRLFSTLEYKTESTNDGVTTTSAATHKPTVYTEQKYLQSLKSANRVSTCQIHLRSIAAK